MTDDDLAKVVFPFIRDLLDCGRNCEGFDGVREKDRELCREIAKSLRSALEAEHAAELAREERHLLEQLAQAKTARDQALAELAKVKEERDQRPHIVCSKCGKFGFYDRSRFDPGCPHSTFPAHWFLSSDGAATCPECVLSTPPSDA